MTLEQTLQCILTSRRCNNFRDYDCCVTGMSTQEPVQMNSKNTSPNFGANPVFAVSGKLYS